MAELWKPQPIEVYKDWLSAILAEASDNLNDWESMFIGSIESKLLENRQLTEAQANRLEQIYVAKTKWLGNDMKTKPRNKCKNNPKNFCYWKDWCAKNNRCMIDKLKKQTRYLKEKWVTS